MSLQPERSEGAPLAFLKFYGSDFLNATASWTMEERGIYMTLLWYSWVNGGLPGDIDRIDRMAPGAKSCWSVLETKFPPCPDGMRRNPRQERDRATMRERSDSAAERGRKGAAQRWGSHSNSHPLAMQQPSGDDGYGMASQRSEFRGQSSEFRPSDAEETNTLNGSAVEPVSVQAETKQRRKPLGTDADFELWWRTYPRRVGKTKARAAWLKALPAVKQYAQVIDEAVAEVMQEAVASYVADPETKKLEPQYIPHPATWLNEGRYIDILEKIDAR